MPDLLGNITGWLEHDGEGEGELQREEHPHQIIEHPQTPSSRQVLKHIACSTGEEEEEEEERGRSQISTGLLPPPPMPYRQ